MYWTENYQILIYGRQMCNILAKPILPGELPDVPKLKAYMVKIMNMVGGVGLAAPQIGVYKQFVIFREKDQIVDLVNPYITKMCGKEISAPEGCLSLPPVENQCLVPRLETVHLEASTSADPVRKEFVYHNFSARKAQHEIDHLTGTFFVDRITSARREEVLERFEQWKFEKRRMRRRTDNALTGIVPARGNAARMP